MSGLAGRIAARLDALEVGARAATSGPWQVGESWAGSNAVLDADGHPLAVCGDESPGYDKPATDAAHIAAWDPAAVLRLVDGLRAVVGRHQSIECGNVRCGGDGLHCAECDPHDGGPDPWPCPTLLGIAAALGVEVGE